MLRNTSHRHVRYLRREHLSALAGSSEQLADIMLSCACTNVTPELKQESNNKTQIDPHLSVMEDKVGIKDVIENETIRLLYYLSETTISEEDRENKIKYYETNIVVQGRLGKLDRALLYYWSASRYYEIASMYHESVHCIERMVKVIEDYLSLQGIKKNNGEIIGDKNSDLYKAKSLYFQLLNNLFMHASRMVGRQYDNFDMAEIHEYKWLFHLEHTDDIDLAKLTQFPNLHSIFLTVVRSKVLLFNLTELPNVTKRYIGTLYSRVAPALRHECTFQSEVELNYTKAYLNHIILIDLLGGDLMRGYRNSLFDENRKYYQIPFFESLRGYLSSKENKQYEKDLFDIDDGNVQSRLDLIDNLVFDSLVCLYNVIKILPPHNQITTFTHGFVADVYNDLWEWSKYYEMFYNLYFYYRCFSQEDEEGMDKIARMMDRFAEVKDREQSNINTLLHDCADEMSKNGVACKDDFGYRYSKLFMNLRHEMDDATIHHIYTNYSAEMALKYYRAARGINSEGMEYKNLIYGMYVLDDDLRNDTCQSNLADERYMLNSGWINLKRKQIQRMYEDSNINQMRYYEDPRKNDSERSPYEQLPERYKDSPFLNTEY